MSTPFLDEPMEKGWRRLLCDIVQTAYDQVANLHIEHYRKIRTGRIDPKTGKEVVHSAGGRVKRTREALASAAWLASSSCVEYTEAAGFHPSRLWSRPDWQAHIRRLLGYLEDPHMKGKYDRREKRLVREAYDRYNQGAK